VRPHAAGPAILAPLVAHERGPAAARLPPRRDLGPPHRPHRDACVRDQRASNLPPLDWAAAAIAEFEVLDQLGPGGPVEVSDRRRLLHVVGQLLGLERRDHQLAVLDAHVGAGGDRTVKRREPALEFGRANAEARTMAHYLTP